MPFLLDPARGYLDEPTAFDIYGRPIMRAAPGGQPGQPAPMVMPAPEGQPPPRPLDPGATLQAAKLAAEGGLAFVPGSGVADAFGYSPNIGGGSDKPFYPSLWDNITHGEWGTAAGQALGVAGDAAVAASPFTLGVAAPIGLALKGAGKTVKEVAAAEKAAATARAAKVAPPPIVPTELPAAMRGAAETAEAAPSTGPAEVLDAPKTPPAPPPAPARAAPPPGSTVASLLAPTSGTSRMRGNRIVGAPSKVKTPQQEDEILQNYLQLAVEGASGRDWYSDAGKYILKMTGGDPVEASRFAAFLAVTSAGTPVEGNLEFAARAWNQWKMGAPLETGRYPKEMVATITRVLQAEDPAAIFSTLGRKRGTFAQALAYKGGWISDAPKGYVNDVWNGRAMGYEPKGAAKDVSLKPTQHDWMDFQQDRALDVANQLGLGGHSDWDRQRLQAAVWAAIKARKEKTSVSAAAREYSSFGDQIEGRVSMEVGGGPLTPSTWGDRFNKAPWKDRQAFTDDVQGALTNASGRNRLADAAGLLSTKTERGMGGYFNSAGEWVVNPNIQFGVLTGKNTPKGRPSTVEAASDDALDFLAAGHTIILGEESVGVAVPGARTTAKGTSKTGTYDIDLGRAVEPRDMQEISRLMQEVYGPDAFSRMGVQSAPGGNGLRIFSYTPLKGEAGTAFAEGGQRLGERLGVQPRSVTNRERRRSTADTNHWDAAPADMEAVQKIVGNEKMRELFDAHALEIIEDVMRVEKGAGKVFGDPARTGLIRVRQAIVRAGSIDGLLKLPRNALSVGALTILAGCIAKYDKGAVAGEEPATTVY